MATGLSIGVNFCSDPAPAQQAATMSGFPLLSLKYVAPELIVHYIEAALLFAAEGVLSLR